jgi:hypothetical protein
MIGWCTGNGDPRQVIANALLRNGRSRQKNQLFDCECGINGGKGRNKNKRRTGLQYQKFHPVRRAIKITLSKTDLYKNLAMTMGPRKWRVVDIHLSNGMSDGIISQSLAPPDMH